MARGKRRPNEIAQTAGVDSQSVSTYLQKLCRLRLIERHIPVTESPTSSKRGRYRLSDPLFRFWFRFVYGNQDRLRLKGDDAYKSIVKPEFADYASPISRYSARKHFQRSSHEHTKNSDSGGSKNTNSMFSVFLRKDSSLESTSSPHHQ
jgi:AAA+ ATPase superfamily predicted ATPase